MGARARSVEETRNRVLEAFFELASVRMFPEISLDDVASEAGVSVQTVLRHFGNRDSLIDQTMAYGAERVGAEMEAPVGDVAAAARAIVDHHERRGRTALLMLAQETSHPQIAKITGLGRDLHRRWVQRVFEPFIGNDEDLANLLVVATDVYTWKLLRLDMKLTRGRAERHLARLLQSILPSSASNGDPP
jgi:AcrR family transcriptional regulator